MSNILWPHELQSTRILCPWDFPGKKTREGCHFLLQGIFSTQRLNHISCIGRRILYHLTTKEAHVHIYMYTYGRHVHNRVHFKVSYTWHFAFTSACISQNQGCSSTNLCIIITLIGHFKFDLFKFDLFVSLGYISIIRFCVVFWL